jgi:hypothetical protein
MGDTHFLRKSLLTLGGLLVWAAHFALIYAITAFICARGLQGRQLWGLGALPLATGLATLAALAAALAILLIGRRRHRAARGQHDAKAVDVFMNYCTMALAGLSLLAIIWNAVPILIVPACQ